MTTTTDTQPFGDGSDTEPEDAYSLPSWVYHNAEFFDLEQQQIFASAWQIVCHTSDLPNPGDYQLLELLEEQVFVIRGQDGAIRAFFNVCRHRASRLLVDPSGHCPGRIVCPYHAWAYEATGELVWVPFEEDYENLDKNRHGLVAVDCCVVLGFVFVRLASDGPDLETILGPALEELKLYRTEELQPLTGLSTREVNVNWKNGTDNYVDALHVRAAHPGLNTLLNKTYTLAYLGDGVHRLHGNVEHIVGNSDLASRYHQCLPVVDFLPDSHRRLWLYYMIWPNLAFNIYPDQVEFMQFVPVTPTTTRIRFGNYAVPDERPEMQEARQLNIDLNVEIGTEDTELIEGVQASMASKSYVRGPLGKNEICLRAFAQRMRQILPVSQELEAPPPGQVTNRNVELESS